MNSALADYDFTVIPAKAGIQWFLKHSRLFAALTLRAALRTFNALRAFVPPARE